MNDAADTLWVGTANGLYSIDMKRNQQTLFVNQPISRVAYMGNGRIGVTNEQMVQWNFCFQLQSRSHLNISLN